MSIPSWALLQNECPPPPPPQEPRYVTQEAYEAAVKDNAPENVLNEMVRNLKPAELPQSKSVCESD